MRKANDTAKGHERNTGDLMQSAREELDTAMREWDGGADASTVYPKVTAALGGAKSSAGAFKPPHG